MKLKALLPLLLLTLLPATLAARKQRTGPARVAAETSASAEVEFDTIVPPPDAVRLSGYDKPNNAVRETFFITNLMPDSLDIEAVNVTLTYLDMSGRILHEASHTVRASVPAAQTRNVSVPAWDRNRAFHYFRSAAPARRASTPYKVVSQVNYIIR